MDGSLCPSAVLDWSLHSMGDAGEPSYKFFQPSPRTTKSGGISKIPIHRSKRQSNNGCCSMRQSRREPGTRGNHIGGRMSNTHGHLPKAERAQLPAELQQRLEAW